ncbi:hypothetical protein V8J88_19825 [Massilia sp. W12]|uniref:hypothetical protein n=1 Tax=Massilia sp. W12 TaxID=3126507 RepID=UPI0030CF27F6
METLEANPWFSLRTPFAWPAAAQRHSPMLHGHGVSGMLALDWLRATLTRTTFVISMHSLAPCAPLPHSLGRQAILGQTQQVTLADCACAGYACAMGSGVMLALYDRSGSVRHLLAMAHLEEGFFMFDPHCGVYHAPEASACAHWLQAVCRHGQADHSPYVDWLHRICLLPMRFQALGD